MTARPNVESTPESRVRESHTNRFTILTVCTANICRSPLMELLMRQQLDTSVYEVGSAGVRGFRNTPMDPAAAEQAVRFGADPQYFRSRALTPDMVTVSQLVLTATREHRSSVLAVAPTALKRTFTLLEFAQLAEHYPTDSLDELITLATRNRSSVKRPIDISDPFRQGELVHQQIAERILDGVRTVSTTLNEFAANQDAAAR